MTMIKQASRAIEHMTARERRVQRAKYARRNKMHHIDKLLNELEMLNLADQRQMPPVLSVAINKVIEDSPEVTGLAQAKPASVMEAMDALYEIQDSLMYNQIEDEKGYRGSQETFQAGFLAGPASSLPQWLLSAWRTRWLRTWRRR